MTLTINKTATHATITATVPLNEDPYLTIQRSDGAGEPMLRGAVHALTGTHSVVPGGVPMLAQLSFGRPAATPQPPPDEPVASLTETYDSIYGAWRTTSSPKLFPKLAMPVKAEVAAEYRDTEPADSARAADVWGADIVYVDHGLKAPFDIHDTPPGTMDWAAHRQAWAARLDALRAAITRPRVGMYSTLIPFAEAGRPDLLPKEESFIEAMAPRLDYLGFRAYLPYAETDFSVSLVMQDARRAVRLRDRYMPGKEIIAFTRHVAVNAGFMEVDRVKFAAFIAGLRSLGISICAWDVSAKNTSEALRVAGWWRTA